MVLGAAAFMDIFMKYSSLDDHVAYYDHCEHDMITMLQLMTMIIIMTMVSLVTLALSREAREVMARFLREREREAPALPVV